MSDGKTPEDFIRISQELAATKDAHKVLQGQYADLEAKLKPLEGVNIQELIANNAKYQEFLEKGGKGAKDQTEFDALWTEREQALRTENQTKIDELTSKLTAATESSTTWQNRFNELTIVDAAMSVITPHFLVNEDIVEFLKDKIRKEVGKDDTGFFVKDKDGKPSMKDGGTVRTSLEDYGKSLVSKFPSLARDKSLSGTRTPSEGTRPNDSDAGKPIEKTKQPPAGFSSWSPRKMQEWYEQNPDAVPPKFN